MYIAAIALVAACDIHAEPSVTDHVTLESRSSDLRELHEIRGETIIRLYDRGHTIDELEAATDAEDAAEVRRMLGLTETEYARYAQRMRAIAERLENGRGYEEPTPPQCPWHGCEEEPSPLITDGDCDFVGMTICTASSAYAAPTGTPVGWVIAVLALQQCYCGNCWGGLTIHFCGDRR